MKLKSILSASLFAAIAALSMNAQAASDLGQGAEAKAPAADAPATKQTKPHSHVEAKYGAPLSTPVAQADQPNPAKDMQKHVHARDAK